MKYIRVTNNGESIGTPGISGFEKPAAGPANWIIHVHIHFPNDDLLFLLEFLRRQRSVLHDVAKYIYCDLGTCIWHINVVNRPVERSKSVHITASFLNLLINTTAWTCGGTFKQHVFEHMGKTRSQPLAFVNAPSHTPGLC